MPLIYMYILRRMTYLYIYMEAQGWGRSIAKSCWQLTIARAAVPQTERLGRTTTAALQDNNNHLQASGIKEDLVV